ncbi:hypothetical protein [Virgisporangium aurantiacum]|uniref:Uncharacterized protein n=1 Tax=Virgisporangium aurantiacum TaxID=175570 RepID=A0A8J4E6J6_9ACTN|nr:hypothetical protein [Virgisporangium aurantiacum]GIJ63294.1 hypothetical protein Vau01_108100 [Virgisporangium aurantiacum]
MSTVVSQTLIFAEPDYMYGAGNLRLRVERVSTRRFIHDNDTWVMVEGVEIGWDGAPRDLRQVAVRASELGG